MSKLETNTIDTVSGTTNLTIGSTNTSTITVPSGKLTGQNYQSFRAFRSSTQSISDNTSTKVQFDSETFDTDNLVLLNDLPIIGGRTASFKKDFDKSEIKKLNYGTRLATIQDVVDFLLGYNARLNDIWSAIPNN